MKANKKIKRKTRRRREKKQQETRRKERKRKQRMEKEELKGGWSGESKDSSPISLENIY